MCVLPLRRAIHTANFNEFHSNAAGETVTGECSYTTKYGSYGAKVDVTVKGNVIVDVKLHTDEETGWVRTTKSWKEGQNPGDLGYDKAEAAYQDWFNKVFIGKSVDEVKAYVASATAEGQSVTTEAAKLAGATQSSARIIVAVQDALSKLGK